MSKLRFTDAEKWRDPWFQELPLAIKALWQYLTDNCDNAGVWVVNRREAEFHLGQTIDWDMAAKALAGRVQPLSPGKWHLTKFVAFQHPGGLTEKSAPHRQVMRLMALHGIPFSSKEKSNHPPAHPAESRLPSSLPPRLGTSTKDKDTEEDEDIDKDSRESAERVKADQRKAFPKLLKRLRVADGPDAAERWWTLALDTHAKTFEQRTDAIWWAVTEGKRRGQKVQYSTDVEAIAMEWRPPAAAPPSG